MRGLVAVGVFLLNAEIRPAQDKVAAGRLLRSGALELDCSGQLPHSIKMLGDCRGHMVG